MMSGRQTNTVVLPAIQKSTCEYRIDESDEILHGGMHDVASERTW